MTCYVKEVTYSGFGVQNTKYNKIFSKLKNRFDNMSIQEAWVDGFPLEYHLKQWDQPKQSTKAFKNFINAKVKEKTIILDLAAGTGAPTYYLAKHFPETSFIASDHSKKCVEIGRKIIEEKTIPNLSIKRLDWFKLIAETTFDGLISLQSLSWLPELEKPLKIALQNLNPNWFAFTSLFYEGDITFNIDVRVHKNEERMQYNIYSLKHLERIARSLGYQVTSAEKFNIDIEIPKPENCDFMGTYTRKFEGDAHLTQISGALLMPWYMVMIEKC